MTDAPQRLKIALENAIERYEFMHDAKIEGEVTLTVGAYDDFVALARPTSDGVEIVVSFGVFNSVTDLWNKALVVSERLPEDSRFNVGHVDDAIDESLTWLMLHELSHHTSGHLKLIGSAGIAETCLPPALGLTSRVKSKPIAMGRLSEKQTLVIRRCLELQADFQAIDVTIGQYSNKNWDYMRFYMACAVAMIVLIDEKDEAADKKRTHPMAITRAFHLFSVLITLYQSASISESEIPNNDEIDAFYRAVIAPAISDYSMLATAVGSKAIFYSQKDIDDLLSDIQILQYPKLNNLLDLKTEGAREYEFLTRSNEQASTLREI